MNDSRHTILIVDDDEEIIDLLADHFRKRNCETIATADPATAVEKLINFSVKLMLLDLKMNKLDGFEVLDKIKQAGLTLPPTIIITGYLPKYADRLKSHGVDLRDVVTKPFDFDVMEACINRKLGQQIVVSEVGSEYEDKIYEKNFCKIGIVEDEEDLLHDFASFFEDRNYSVYSYLSVEEALRGLKKNDVDILFVDMKFTGRMQGHELIEELSKSSPRLPMMISISASPILDEMRARLESFGCKTFIEKPFDAIEIIELVKTLAIQKGLLG